MRKFFLTLFAITAMSLSCIAQDFVINNGAKATIYLPETDRPVVGSAFEMLQGDMKQVLNASILKVKKQKKADIVCSINAELPREGFSISVKQGKLYIEGADTHGLAYGLLEVSRLMGVSPWVYFADCTPKSLKEFKLAEGMTKKESPAVAYRGIFINDEDWGMNPWATKQEPEALTMPTKRINGAVGPKVNEKIFQLLLRLRANYYWPAMHECTQPFYLTKGNREMAAKYGIYMGGSHCEPMACSAAGEWALRGKGDYDYVHNRDAVKKFWQDRLDSVKDQEVVYTLGMRGVHDGSMQGVKTPADKLKYLQMVIDDQREMLRNTVLPAKSKLLPSPVAGKGLGLGAVPQVFVPYKEVLEVYRSGLKVPDDVTLMWTDDNYGYIRHFPDSIEASRKGGNGIYYHISYWGRPHDYVWLATFSPNLLYQQMKEGYDRGIKNMWILNVGDIKPGEYLTEEFLDMAWYGTDINKQTSTQSNKQTTVESVMQHMLSFYQREFGNELAPAIALAMEEFYDLANDRKPEHMAGTRTEEKDKAYWSEIHPIDNWTKSDVEKRVKRYQKLSDDIEALWTKVPADKRDAFFELVKYPVQGCAQMNFKYLVPEKCTEAYDSIQSLTYIYNKVVANGKWDTMMASKPRYQHVFDKIAPEELPIYTDSIVRKEVNIPNLDEWAEIHRTVDISILNKDFDELSTSKIDELSTSQSADSITIEVRLLPNLPVGKEYRLAFSLQLDDNAPQTREYQTYDREEEWKQNVFHNYAVKTFRFPIDKSLTEHHIRFTPLTDGVVLRKILLCNH